MLFPHQGALQQIIGKHCLKGSMAYGLKTPWPNTKLYNSFQNVGFVVHLL